MTTKKISTKKDLSNFSAKEGSEKQEGANGGKFQETARTSLAEVKSTALERWKERNSGRMSAPKFKKIKDMTVTLEVSGDLQQQSFAAETSGSADIDFFKTLISQVTSTYQSENCEERANYSSAFMHGLNPSDETEGILIAQMTGTHNLIMEFMKRAVLSGQTAEGSNDNTNKACRLMSIFLKQIETLEKYRGKSAQQKVLVEHVHIHEGGRAIVGNVENKPRGEGDE